MGLLDQWNKNKFSIYKSEEKTVLKLIEEIGKWLETLIKGLDGKTDLYGDHKGSWQGLKRPTLSEEGLRATVEKLIDEDLPNIENSLNEKANKTEIENSFNELTQILDKVESDILINKDYFNNQITEINNKTIGLRLNAKYPPLGLMGCKGDGLTDDTENLNKIIEFVNSNNGGVIEFPQGTYKLNNVKMKSKVGLVGLGRTDNYLSETSQCVLKADENATVLINCEGVDGAFFQGLTFDGGENGYNNCICINRGAFITIKDNYFRNFKSAMGDGVGLQTFIIENNKINLCNIGIWSVVDSRIINNTINANVIGIKFGSGANDNIITSNKIEWNSGFGIEMYLCTSNVISENIIDRSGSVGITASNVNNTIISNNVFRRNGSTTLTPRDMSQIYLETCSNMTLNGNISKVDNTHDDSSGKNAPENGFTIYNSTKIIVSANILNANSGKSLDSWNNTELIDTNNIKNLPN